MVLFSDIRAAQQGDATALAKLGADAFEEGRVVEAVYWLVMADLRGFHHLAGVLQEYAETWQEMGCPEQKNATSEFFTEDQRQFGLSALAWITGVDQQAARNWFICAARSGNYDARDFMTAYGM